MRVGIVSEMPTMATGFANQGAMLAEGLKQRGYDVIYLGANGSPAEQTNYPCLLLNYGDIELLERYHRELKFDWLIFLAPAPFWLSLQNSVITKECCILYWVPIESVFVDKRLTGFFDFLGSGLIHLAEYYNKLWKPFIGERKVIPHGINMDVFKPLEDTVLLKKKWSRKLGCFLGDFVILNLDRNTWRKRWDLTFDILRHLKKRYDVTLICHTTTLPPTKNGGVNLKDLAKIYEVEENVVFTENNIRKGLNKEELNELYNIADVRLSTSMAEGWGIPTAEAMASGCLNVVPNNTTFPEIVGEYGLKIDCVANAYYYGTYGSVVDVVDAVEKISWVFENPSMASVLKEKALEKVKEYDKEKIIDMFDTYIKQLDRENYRKNRYIAFEKFLPRRIDNFRKYVKLGRMIGKLGKIVDFWDVTHGFDIFGTSLVTNVRGRTDMEELVYEGAKPFVVQVPVLEYNNLGYIAVVGRLFERTTDKFIEAIIKDYNWVIMEVEEDCILSKASNYKTSKHWEKFMNNNGFEEIRDLEILFFDKSGVKVKIFKKIGVEMIDYAVFDETEVKEDENENSTYSSSNVS